MYTRIRFPPADMILPIIDRRLNVITMYRVVLYGLLLLSGLAITLGFARVLSYSGLQLLASFVVISAACYLSNLAFSAALKVPANKESSAITALILFLLLPPPLGGADAAYIALGGAIAMASKYLLAYRGKHLFNPAALGAFVLGFTPLGGAIWWVGTPAMFVPTALIGLLIVRKTRRIAVFVSCLVTSVVTFLAYALWSGEASSAATLWSAFLQHALSWPILFFASVMVTEPLTLPPMRREQILYGAVVGVLSSWPFHVGPVYGTPEFALLFGNLLSYAVSLRRRLRLTLAEKTLVARETYEFSFDVSPPLAFLPGQYLEWTLPHAHADDRGIRRYFTIASSPTEAQLKLGIRIGEKMSTYKAALKSLEPGARMFAGQLYGDFVLPKDPSAKLAFIAGGIGVTPFRSMIKWLVDTKQERDMVLLYSAREDQDVAYRPLFDEAAAIGLRSVYMLSGNAIPKLTQESIATNVPDFAERTFYLSGPTAMVDAYKALLLGMGVHHARIRTDYFPGFA